MRLLRRRPILGLALVSTVATIVGIAIVLLIDWFPEQGATAADDIDLLYDVLLVASVPVFVLVMSVAIYSVVAFRVKPGDPSDGEPIHGNTRLEVIWVTIPFIMVSALAVYGWVVLDDIEAEQPNTLVVNVTGQQFAWRFDYPDDGEVKSNQLMLPKDRPVEFRVRTEDVIHSFWVPAFRLKTDTVPGLTTKIRVTPSRLGTYEIVCTELCGIGHSTMRNSARVIPAAEFDSWLAEQQRSEEDGGAGAGGDDESDAGRELFTDSGCDGCHTLADADAQANVGPSLDDLAEEAERFGGQEGQAPEEYVRTAIEDPSAFAVPGFDAGTMPADYSERLSDAEIDALVQYLLDVGGGGEQ